VTDSVYELIYEDLTHLGGPMGTEYTTEHSMGLYHDIDEAKRVAESDYEHEIEWLRYDYEDENDTEEDMGYTFRSPDLGYVMYYIRNRAIQ